MMPQPPSPPPEATSAWLENTPKWLEAFAGESVDQARVQLGRRGLVYQLALRGGGRLALSLPVDPVQRTLAPAQARARHFSGPGPTRDAQQRLDGLLKDPKGAAIQDARRHAATLDFLSGSSMQLQGPTDSDLQCLFELLNALSRGNEDRPGGWSESRDPFVLGARACAQIIFGGPLLPFPEPESLAEAAPAWLELLSSILHGDIERVQEQAQRSPLACSGQALALMTGALFREAGFTEAAEKLLESGIPFAHAGRRCDLWIELAQLLTARGERERAREMLRRAVEHAGEEVRHVMRATRELLRVGAMDDAYLVLRQWSHRHPSELELLIALAELTLVAGEFAEVESLLDRVDALEAGRRDSLRLRAALGITLGELEPAREILAKLWAEDPSDWVTGTWLTECYLRLGRHDDAAATHKEARAVHDSPVHTLLQGAMVERAKMADNWELSALLEHWGETWTLADCMNANEDPYPAREPVLKLLTEFRGARGENLVRVDPRAKGPLGVRPVSTRLPDPISESRALSADAVKCIITETPETVFARFARLEERFPESPHPFCYRGEVRLWLGDYAGAFADFTQALETRTTRWGYVGKAAVYLLEGQRERGIAEIEACRRSFAPVPSATTHIYLGEAERKAGNHEAAIQQLEESIRVKPGRLSGWINLCLAHRELGHEAISREHFQRIARTAPRLLWDAAVALGQVERDARPSWTAAYEDAPALLEHALVMMRGNRSSHTMTYYDAQGVFRQVRDAEAWAQKARRTRSYLWDEARRRCFWPLPD